MNVITEPGIVLPNLINEPTRMRLKRVENYTLPLTYPGRNLEGIKGMEKPIWTHNRP